MNPAPAVHKRPSAESSRLGLLWAALVVDFAILYGLTLRRDYTYDGLCYALDVEFAPIANLFHPNHLLYSAVVSRLWHLAQSVGLNIRAIFFMQSVNALAAAAAVGTLGWIIGRRTYPWLGGLLAIFFGASYAVWSEATDPGCYAWAALAACLLLGLLIGSDQADAFWIGVGHGALCLFHQMLILVVPAFWVEQARRDEKPFWAILRYSLGVALAFGVPYAIVAGVFHGPTFHGALYWALGPAGPPPGTAVLSHYWWNFGFAKDLHDAWTGWVQSLIAPSASFWPLGLGSFIFALALGAWLAWWVREARRKTFSDRSFWPLLTWVVVFNVFLFFFWTGTLRYRILFWPPLLYLAATALNELSRRWVSVVGSLLAGVLIAHNASAGIAPLRQPSLESLRAAWVDREVRLPNFLVFSGMGERSVRNVYMAYFAPLTPARSLFGVLFSNPKGDLAPLTRRALAAEKMGGRLVVEKDLLDPAVQARIESERGTPPGTLARWLKGFRTEGELEGPAGYRLVRLRARQPK